MSDPRQKDFDERHTKLPVVTALTKREYFAAMAMQGLLPMYDRFENHEFLCADAIQIADTLLKQLEK